MVTLPSARNADPPLTVLFKDVKGVSWAGAVSAEVTVAGMTLAGVTLADETLAGVTLGGVTLGGVTLAGVTLAGVTLAGVAFAGVTLAGVALAGVTLDGVALGGGCWLGVARGGGVTWIGWTGSTGCRDGGTAFGWAGSSGDRDGGTAFGRAGSSGDRDGGTAFGRAGSSGDRDGGTATGAIGPNGNGNGGGGSCGAIGTFDVGVGKVSVTGLDDEGQRVRRHRTWTVVQRGWERMRAVRQGGEDDQEDGGNQDEGPEAGSSAAVPHLATTMRSMTALILVAAAGVPSQAKSKGSPHLTLHLTRTAVELPADTVMDSLPITLTTLETTTVDDMFETIANEPGQGKGQGIGMGTTPNAEPSFGNKAAPPTTPTAPPSNNKNPPPPLPIPPFGGQMGKSTPINGAGVNGNGDAQATPPVKNTASPDRGGGEGSVSRPSNSIGMGNVIVSGAVEGRVWKVSVVGAFAVCLMAAVVGAFL
ncbi:hypothetical protein HK101_000838 [Irineochytrium annulatum]|nr:hypothetical protein HK101_000838 [Irineochytrium annulatum]